MKNEWGEKDEKEWWKDEICETYYRSKDEKWVRKRFKGVIKR